MIFCKNMYQNKKLVYYRIIDYIEIKISYDIPIMRMSIVKYTACVDTRNKYFHSFFCSILLHVVLSFNTTYFLLEGYIAMLSVLAKSYDADFEIS